MASRTASTSPSTAQYGRGGSNNSVRWLVPVAALLAVMRLGVGLLINEITLSWFPGTSYAPGGTGGNAATSLLRWDSGWYVGLAFHWYPFKRALVYFPGYPVLIRGVQAVSAHAISLNAAALGVAWVSFVIAAPLMAVFMARLLPLRTAVVALILFLWSPASVFLLSAYPDSSFIALTLGALLLVSRRQIWGAAILAGAATAFSPLGLCLSVAIVVEALRQKNIWKSIIIGFISVSAMVAWTAWQTVAYGSPILFLTQQATFNRHTSLPFLSLIDVAAHLDAIPPPGISQTNFILTRSINFAFGLISLMVFIYYVADIFRHRERRFPIYFSIYSSLSLLMPSFSTQSFGGVANPEALTRLATDSVGIYPALARIAVRSRWVLLPGLGLWVGIAIIVEIFFVRGWYFT